MLLFHGIPSCLFLIRSNMTAQAVVEPHVLPYTPTPCPIHFFNGTMDDHMYPKLFWTALNKKRQFVALVRRMRLSHPPDSSSKQPGMRLLKKKSII